MGRGSDCSRGRQSRVLEGCLGRRHACRSGSLSWLRGRCRSTGNRGGGVRRSRSSPCLVGLVLFAFRQAFFASLLSGLLLRLQSLE